MKCSSKQFASLGLIVGALAVLLLGLTTAPALAQDITLTDNNSQIKIDPLSQAGMKQWTVDGVNYDAKQWFWYRIGSTGGEQSLDTLTMSSAPALSDLSGDGVMDTANIKYTTDLTNHGLNINVKLSLQGSDPGFGASNIAEQIRIENKTSSPIDLHFFQYNNFILSNGQDTVTFDNNNHVIQTAPVVILGELIGENTGDGFVSGFPKHEGALVSTTLDSLNDSSPTTFASGLGSVGPGNVSWAFEWDVSLAANGYLIISKGKSLSVVPEPSSILLLSLFGACLGFGWWRGKRLV